MNAEWIQRPAEIHANDLLQLFQRSPRLQTVKLLLKTDFGLLFQALTVKFNKDEVQDDDEDVKVMGAVHLPCLTRMSLRVNLGDVVGTMFAQDLATMVLSRRRHCDTITSLNDVYLNIEGLFEEDEDDGWNMLEDVKNRLSEECARPSFPPLTLSTEWTSQ